LLHNFFVKVSNRVRAICYSFFYNVGSGCNFGNISFASRERSSIKVGDKVTIWRHTELCGKPALPITIDNGTFINQRCVIRPNVTIGKNVNIAPGVMLLSDTHEIGSSEKRAGTSIYPPINIKDGCWIGANSTILGNVTIGKGTIIAAGSIVNKDCEPNSLYAGVPAKLVKKLD
jgi:acetyltransferase-like isoleucine patch superfamily enzyme